MNIALITEGASEQNIISTFLEYYLRDEDPDITRLFPKSDPKGKQEGIGGWAEVLRFISDQTDRIREALLYSDLLIIQIDSDQSQHSPFNVDHLHNGKEKSTEQLWSDIQTRLIELMESSFWSEYSGRILFAISIHTTECWLLPILFSGNKVAKTKGCLDALNIELDKKNLNTISKEKKNDPSAIKAVKDLIRLKKKPKEIREIASHHFGFQHLLDELEKRRPLE